MSRGPLLADLLIAAVAAAIVVILTPGVAMAALIAILVLIACLISVLIDSRRRRANRPRLGRVSSSRPGPVTSRRGQRPPPRSPR